MSTLVRSSSQAVAASLQSYSALQTERDIARLEATLGAHGYTFRRDRLYVIPHEMRGKHEGNHEFSEIPHVENYLAALEIFHAMILEKKSWVHLKAEMQAGKTEVYTTVIRMFLQYTVKLGGFTISDMILTTGMNETSWKEQMEKRLPNGMIENIQHRAGLPKIKAALQETVVAGSIRNKFIGLDESHIAASQGNKPNKELYSFLLKHVNAEDWATNHVYVLTISATDPAKIIKAIGNQHAKVVRLRTNENYQSVAKLQAAGRIRQACSLNEEGSVNELFMLIKETYTASKYHIIRPTTEDYDAVVELFQALKETENIDIIEYNSETCKGIDKSEKDINKTLAKKPRKHTFIFIKGMFYAAKTMNDKYIGVLYDRPSNKKDDTPLQSLLGRACGYGKSKDTIIFTNMQAVANYLALWRDVEAHETNQVINAAMNGATCVRKKGANKSRIKVAKQHATPHAITPKEWEADCQLYDLAGGTPLEFIDSDEFREYICEAFGPYWIRCGISEEDGVSDIRAKARRGITKMTEENGFITCGLEGKKGSKIRSLDDLEKYSIKFKADPLASWGGGNWRNKTDYNIQFKYGYEDTNDKSTLHIRI
jgi:hypothetical protein